MNHIYPVSDSALDSDDLSRRIDAWPAFTTHTATDVVVAAVSMSRLVGWCGTPCVHAADAVVPRSGGRPSETEMGSVVVTRVLSLEWRSDFRLHVEVDADLSSVLCTIEESRVIGREIDASVASVIIEAGPSSLGFATRLTATLEVGDLIAIPCRGIALLHDLRGARR